MISYFILLTFEGIFYVITRKENFMHRMNKTIFILVLSVSYWTYPVNPFRAVVAYMLVLSQSSASRNSAEQWNNYDLIGYTKLNGVLEPLSQDIVMTETPADGSSLTKCTINQK